MGENIKYDVIIIGAGLSGITSANYLVKQGINVLLLDKGKMPGGRMATKRATLQGKQILWDYGCKFLEANSTEFSHKLLNLYKSRTIKSWNVNHDNIESRRVNKYLKFCGTTSIRDIILKESKKLQIRSETKVVNIDHSNELWYLTTENNEKYYADQLMISSPVPQTLDLLNDSQIKLNSEKIQQLEKVKYNKSIVALFASENSSNISGNGGLKFEFGEISFLTDNNLKGVNKNFNSIVVEMSSKFSDENWESSEEEIIEKIKSNVEKWIDGKIIYENIHKWRYSTPSTSYNKRFEYFEQPLPLYLIGDSFLGNDSESAYLSGLNAAKFHSKNFSNIVEEEIA